MDLSIPGPPAPRRRSLVLLVAAVAVAGSSIGLATPQEPFPSGEPPREIPVPPLRTSLDSLPGVQDLPVRVEMPDVMTMADGRRVTTREQWRERREEMKRVLAYYAVGRMPPPPGNVRGHEVASESVVEGSVRYRLVRLQFGPESRLELTIGIFAPAHGQPFPAVILPEGTPPGAAPRPRLPRGPNQGRGENVLLLVGPGPVAAPPPEPPPPARAEEVARRHRELFRRGYALVVFDYNDCAEDTTLRNRDGSWAFRDTRFYPAYPGYDWGILAGWAWGASRIADYLETDRVVDRARLIVTGASRAGKAAMVAAAFDERLMGAPVVSGGGGIGAYRFSGEGRGGREGLDLMMTKYPNWFSPHLHPFRGQTDRLPFDAHWFLALCAPRPFIALEGETDNVSLPNAVKQSILAARPAYALLGAEDRLGVNYARHGHAFTDEDWSAMLDFADEHLRGMKVERAGRTLYWCSPPMPDPVILGSDHAGFELKEKIRKALERLGVPCEDVGTRTTDSVDYPDYAHRVAEAVEKGRYTRGVVVCGTGIGASMAANRHPGVRAAVAYDEETARLSREHNDANVLALGGRSLDHDLAERILEIWLKTPFTGGRHARRVAKIEPGDAEPE